MKTILWHINSQLIRTFGKDGGTGKHGLPPRTATAKCSTKLQDSYHQNCQKIKLYGRPDNQEIKEVTCIYLNRRGRDAKTWRHGISWSHTNKWWIKIVRDILGARDTSPTPDYPSQGSSAREKSPHNFWLKNQWGLAQRKKLGDPQVSPLKVPAADLGLTQTHSLWPPAWGQQLEGHQ